ncbi:MAG: lysoplasmalogenase [Paracoccus sp. (in: a-proteobacteria)]|nr:lysoplasmalogenase [Paracoccus sp. (in: a-proteobacteria)]
MIGKMLFAVLLLAGGVKAALYLLTGAASERPDACATIAKTGATLNLVLAGLVAGAPAWVIWGLAFGALGDFCLTRPGERAFLAGMGAFALGHLLYTAWMLTPENAARALWALPVAALALSAEIWLLPRTGALIWPVRAYVWIITAMAAAAATLPVAHLWAVIGAGLFLASDLALALRLFVVSDPARQRLLSRALWPAYWAGQALILLGSLGPS